MHHITSSELLSMADEVPEEEWKRVSAKGYKAICGSLIWVSRFAKKEISQGISVCCRVMSKPSDKAWRHVMQILAWLRDSKKRGCQFRSDSTEHGLVAATDASNKTDTNRTAHQRINAANPSAHQTKQNDTKQNNPSMHQRCKPISAPNKTKQHRTTQQRTNAPVGSSQGANRA